MNATSEKLTAQNAIAHVRARLWRLPLAMQRAAAFAAGAAATLAHAPLHIVPAFFAAIVVLVWLLDAPAAKHRFLHAFLIGWWFGFGYFLAGLNWIASAFVARDLAYAHLWGAAATLTLAAALALFWGAGAAIARRLWSAHAGRAASFAAAFALTEWIRGNLLGGFPWLLPGYIWPPGEAVSQIASVIGPYGLSALTLFAAAALAWIGDPPSRGRWMLGAAALVFAASIWIWGHWRLAGAPREIDASRPLVRVVDAGLSQREKWTEAPDQEWRVLQRYIEASDNARTEPDIVIWPEGAIPAVNFFALENGAFLRAMTQHIGDRTLILGLTRRAPADEGLAYYNSAVTLQNTDDGPRIAHIYDKHRLVPFGEYIPFWDLLGGFNLAPLQRIGAGFHPGPPPIAVSPPGAPPALILICYEAIFPALVPTADERPEWIVSLTNDAWFGDSAGPFQHYLMARYRTIEFGVPMARAASGGVSAIVDPYGRAITSNMSGGFAEARLPRPLAPTVYAQWREGCFILIIAVLALVGLASRRRITPSRSADLARADRGAMS